MPETAQPMVHADPQSPAHISMLSAQSLVKPSPAAQKSRAVKISLPSSGQVTMYSNKLRNNMIKVGSVHMISTPQETTKRIEKGSLRQNVHISDHQQSKPKLRPNIRPEDDNQGLYLLTLGDENNSQTPKACTIDSRKTSTIENLREAHSFIQAAEFPVAKTTKGQAK